MFRIGHKLDRRAAVTSQSQRHRCRAGSRYRRPCFKSRAGRLGPRCSCIRATLGLARETLRARTMEIEHRRMPRTGTLRGARATIGRRDIWRSVLLLFWSARPVRLRHAGAVPFQRCFQACFRCKLQKFAASEIFLIGVSIH